MQTFLTPLCSPKNKNVLVIGSGWGTEIAWLLGKGAKEVVGVDPAPRSSIPLERYIERNNLSGDYKIIKGELKDIINTHNNYFDLIVSHNVFEHIMDLKEVFSQIPGLLTNSGKVATSQWHEYIHGLNKMTTSSFLKEVIDSGAIVSQFYLKPDRNLSKYPLYKSKLEKTTKLSPFDATIEGISIEFFYVS